MIVIILNCSKEFFGTLNELILNTALGTNLCLNDGTIFVAPIAIGAYSVVGHMVMIAPGLKMGDHSELGSGAALGIGITLGDGVSVGPCVVINHHAMIANRVKIGTHSYIGVKAKINVEGLEIPAFAHIPARSIINSQDELDEILNSQAYIGEQPKRLLPELAKIEPADLSMIHSVN